MSIQISLSAPKVRLGTVMPETIVRMVNGEHAGELFVTVRQASWAAGRELRPVSDSSQSLFVNEAAFVQVVAR